MTACQTSARERFTRFFMTDSKKDRDFLKAIHNNFLSAMHGFRDNVVSLPTGYEINHSELSRV